MAAHADDHVLCKLPMLVDIAASDAQGCNKLWQHYSGMCVFPFTSSSTTTSEGDEEGEGADQGAMASIAQGGGGPRMVMLITDLGKSKHRKRLQRCVLRFQMFCCRF